MCIPSIFLPIRERCRETEKNRRVLLVIPFSCVDACKRALQNVHSTGFKEDSAKVERQSHARACTEVLDSPDTYRGRTHDLLPRVDKRSGVRSYWIHHDNGWSSACRPRYEVQRLLRSIAQRLGEAKPLTRRQMCLSDTGSYLCRS